VAGLLAAAILLGPPAQAASPKYQSYTAATLENLLVMCVEGDDNGCYFYAGRQAKAGKLKEAHDAYLIGAENAKSRSGYVCMFQLARLYQAGQGIDQDLTQAYRWLTHLMRIDGQKDLRDAATSLRRTLAADMKPDRIALSEALAKTRLTK